MNDFETWVHIQQQQMKFFYSLTAITFTILGLSWSAVAKLEVM